MKKFIFAAAVAALALGSCTSIHNTAYTDVVKSQTQNRTSADLSVADNVSTATLQCDWTRSRSGIANAKNAACQKLLSENGGGDVVINPQFEIKTKRTIIGKKIMYVTVTGHVGRYKNFHPTTAAEAELFNSLKVK